LAKRTRRVALTEARFGQTNPTYCGHRRTIWPNEPDEARHAGDKTSSGLAIAATFGRER
jgi:hypothetical protein